LVELVFCVRITPFEKVPLLIKGSRIWHYWLGEGTEESLNLLLAVYLLISHVNFLGKPGTELALAKDVWIMRVSCGANISLEDFHL
jgi:hypothetical protein